MAGFDSFRRKLVFHLFFNSCVFLCIFLFCVLKVNASILLILPFTFWILNAVKIILCCSLVFPLFKI
ncbi:unnamed protein product [Meloidogyne enterolobii]|uniref:Uncharacterized protein n=1 Tax=Meloidogyne enterolobii TaxID=390850 RepID=A0ACB0ZPY6_MELEN